MEKTTVSIVCPFCGEDVRIALEHTKQAICPYCQEHFWLRVTFSAVAIDEDERQVLEQLAGLGYVSDTLEDVGMAVWLCERGFARLNGEPTAINFEITGAGREALR